MDLTGPNPTTDRNKSGTKRHVLTDQLGIPISVVVITPANKYTECLRDIGTVVDKTEKEKEVKEENRKYLQKLKNYKTPVEVAITLNIRENEAAQDYREYCILTDMDSLNRIFRELDDIHSISICYNHCFNPILISF